MEGPAECKDFHLVSASQSLEDSRRISVTPLNIDLPCERCGYGLENTIHVLCDYPFSKAVWFPLLRGHNHQHFFEANLADWMSKNLQDLNNFPGGNLWRVTFGIAIWQLWFWRNQFIFTKAFWESNNIAMDIKVRAAEIQRSNLCSLTAGMARVERWICWTAPLWPWVKLNTDGAKKSSGNAGAGGLICDYRGIWLAGYSVNLGVCLMTSAELWGLFHGLSIA